MDDDYLGKAKMGTKGEVSPRRQELKKAEEKGKRSQQYNHRNGREIVKSNKKGERVVGFRI